MKDIFFKLENFGKGSFGEVFPLRKNSKDSGRIFLVHYPGGEVDFFGEYPVPESIPIEVSSMGIEEVSKKAAERLQKTFFFTSPTGEVKKVSALWDGQSRGFYAHEVYLDGQVVGSRQGWDKDHSWLVGDGSSAWLSIENGALVVLQRDYHSNRPGKWGVEPQITQEVCSLKEIIKVEFQTTSGWEGEFYPLKNKKEKWTCVLHRSTGSVSVGTDLPF